MAAFPAVSSRNTRSRSGRSRVRSCSSTPAWRAARPTAGASVRPGAAGALLVTGADAPTVGRVALEQRVELHELVAERPDLEGVFLELTAGKAGIR